MRALVVVTTLAALLAPATASASGGGLSATFGGAGATAPGRPLTYIAVPAGNRTVIQGVHRDGGAVDRWRELPGVYGVPAVAYDGSTTGLSANGKTLVLSESPRTYPPRRTRLLVLSASNFKTKARVSLPGYSSIDAISPDGRWVYLTRYTAPVRDITKYEVVAYDLQNPGAPEPVVDPEEPDEQMGGIPFSRVVSPDGRWAYTLYDAEEPFVHALDTAGRIAKCIDLPQLAGKDISSAKLRLDGGTLHVGSLAQIDTRTHELVKAGPARPAAARSQPKSPTEDDAAAPWPFVALGLAGLGLVAVAVRRRSAHRAQPAL
jgi:MYXO-CTERM domain-containing protein